MKLDPTSADDLSDALSEPGKMMRELFLGWVTVEGPQLLTKMQSDRLIESRPRR